MAITTNFASQQSWIQRLVGKLAAPRHHRGNTPRRKRSPPYSAADREGHEWIVEERRSGVIYQIIRGSAWRLLADANHRSRNYPNLTTTGINEFAASGGSHDEVSGVCLRAACCLLKSFAVIDQNLALDRFNACGGSRQGQSVLLQHAPLESTYSEAQPQSR